MKLTPAYDTCNYQENMLNVTCYTDITPQVAKMWVPGLKSIFDTIALGYLLKKQLCIKR